MSIVTTPGHLAASTIGAAELAALERHGYEWIAYQAQNGETTRDFDLGPAKAAGLSPGVWGVTYEPGRFHENGRLLGRQARALGAEHVQMDAEECAKDTRSTRGLKPVVDGIRDGGYAGPVSLNTLGAPDNPDVNDYAIDVKSFLDTGGGVFCQAYFNAHDAYRPSACVRYWTRVGVPAGRLNVMIGLHRSEESQSKPGVRLSGAEWVPLLEEAGVKRNFSVFLAEHAAEDDLDALDTLALAPAPVDVTGNRARALELLRSSIESWRAAGMSQDKLAIQRQTLAWRVLTVLQSGSNVRALRELLDDLEAPKP